MITTASWINSSGPRAVKNSEENVNCRSIQSSKKVSVQIVHIIMIIKISQYTFRGRHKTQLRSSHNHILVTYSLWTCPYNDTYYPVVGQSVPLAFTHQIKFSSLPRPDSLPRINALRRANFEGCKITTSRQRWSNKSVQSHSGLREVGVVPGFSTICGDCCCHLGRSLYGRNNSLYFIWDTFIGDNNYSHLIWSTSWFQLPHSLELAWTERALWWLVKQ